MWSAVLTNGLSKSILLYRVINRSFVFCSSLLASMSSKWQKLRRDFPITKACIYLDHAAGGPIPLPVSKRIQAYYTSHIQKADFAWPKWIEEREVVRRKVASFIHADPSEVTFIQSTSQGMNLIAELLACEGAVLTNEIEFPSSTLPWIWRGVDVIFQEAEGGRIPLSKMKSLLSSKVKTIVSSLVQFATGFRQDFRKLGQLKGNRFLVINATQGFGAVSVNVKAWNADFLCTNSYKWLMAGYGGGILYIRKEWLEKFKPMSVGWRSMKEPERMDNRRIDVRRDAARYEWGCPSFPTLFAVGAAVDYLNAIGIEAIEKRVLALTGYAIEELERKGYEVITPKADHERAGIVIFRFANAEKLCKKMLGRKIYVSARGAGIRIAPHFYNTFEEIDSFLRMLSKA